MNPDASSFRIGVGSGFAGDRYDPAERLARDGHLDALVFETLAERTIALAQQRLRSGSGEGFDPRLMRRLQGTLAPILRGGGAIVTNGGAADPRAAARAAKRMAIDQGFPAAKVVAVTGDDVMEDLDLGSSVILGTDRPLADLRERIVSAHAYIGAGAASAALSDGAQIVVAGRMSDPALFLAPLVARFGWTADVDGEKVAAGLLIGHLLECGGQLSGGYFADDIRKRIPDLAHLGFPFADVTNDGVAVFQKLSGTGGRLDLETVSEQLLYEIDDPNAYITPDGILDLIAVEIDDLGGDRVAVRGARYAGRPDRLKVSVGIDDGYRSAAGITYAGPDALDRARLAERIVKERWADVHGHDETDLVCEYMGVNSARHWWTPDDAFMPPEVRLRFGVRALELSVATTLCEEVEALYTNGPAGGGGVSTHLAPSIGIVSTLIDRQLVNVTAEEIS